MGVLNPDDMAPGLAQGGGEPVDDGGDGERCLDEGGRALAHHETILHVDDDERGPGGIERPERMLAAVPRQRRAPRPFGHVETGHLFLLRSEEHTSEPQSLMRISYAVLC